MDFIVPIKVTDASLLSTNATNDAGIPLWEVGQTIAVGDERRYEATNIHWIVVAVQAHTTSLANAPTGLNNDPFWQYKFDTNPWRMFDQSSTSFTSMASFFIPAIWNDLYFWSDQLNWDDDLLFNEAKIDTSIVCSGAINAVALTGLSSNEVTIEHRDLNGTLIYQRTENLNDNNGVVDAFTYFFQPLMRKSTLVVKDLPLAYLSTVRLIIKNNAGNAECANVIVGKLEKSGFTEYGMKIGIRDYSVKETDDFGNTILTVRKFKATMTLTTRIKKEQSAALRNKFNALRAKPVFYIGDESDSSSQIYGYYQDSYNLATYFSDYQMNFEIEELA